MDAPAARFSLPAYSWYALGVLFVVNIFHVIDRQVFSILQDSIKADLQLSDTALGLLGGLAFALFYTTFGIPIARLADRRSRTKIVAASLAVWSGMTALCGLATSLTTLALARVGVGVGEAGCSPATHSLLADYFPAARRSAAFAILTVGTSAGVSLGFYLGGTLDHLLGWRHTLILLALPGLLFSVFVLLCLREPRRGAWDKPAQADASADQPGIRAVFGTLWRIPTFRHVLLAYAIHYFAVQGSGAWKASYFRRTFTAIDTGTLGSALALAAALAAIGIIAGGLLADRLTRRDKRWFAWLPIATILLAMPFFVAMLFVQDWRLATVFYCFDVGLNAAFAGPTLALIQTLVPARLRAVAASIVLLLVSLIGMGLGPLLVGALSDVLVPLFGAASLRYALLVAVAANLWAMVHYGLAAKTVAADIGRLI